jgi:DNA gyrase subunit A
LHLTITTDRIPLMGTNSQGKQALKIGARESIIACLPVKQEDELLLVSRLGYGKKLPVQSVRIVEVGNLGTHVMQFADKTDYLIHVSIANGVNTIDLVSTDSRIETISTRKIGTYGKEGAGDRPLNLKNGESLIGAVTR